MRTSKNDITGDAIKSRPTTDAFAFNWERIFAKKDCPQCDGAGKVVIVESSEKCGACDGSGKVEKNGS